MLKRIIHKIKLWDKQYCTTVPASAPDEKQRAGLRRHPVAVYPDAPAKEEYTMLKKLLTTMMVCAAAFCGALAETVPDPFAGLWADPAIGRAELSIMPIDPRDAGPGERLYRVLLTWGSSAFEHSAWTMTARLEDGALVYTGGRHDDIAFGEDGAEVSDRLLWQDAEGRFTLSEDDRLLWTDSRESTAPDFRFERQLKFSPTVQELSENVVGPIADIQTGTAGASLKAAETACDVVRFAWSRFLWNADPAALEENLNAAIAALDDDARGRFKENLPEVARLLDAAFAGDADASFDDAGVSDAMAAITGDAEARQSWRTLEALLLP